MLPKNKLRDAKMARLKLYGDDQHNHQAQQLTEVEVKV